MTAPLRIIFAGTPDFAAKHLAALIESEHEVIAVYTQPDRPAGRGAGRLPPPRRAGPGGLEPPGLGGALRRYLRGRPHPRLHLPRRPAGLRGAACGRLARGRWGEAVEVWLRDEIGAVAQGKRKHRGKGERRAPGYTQLQYVSLKLELRLCSQGTYYNLLLLNCNSPCNRKGN